MSLNTGNAILSNGITLSSTYNVGIGNPSSIEGVLTIKGTSAQPPSSGTTANSLLQLVGSLGSEINIGSNTVTGGYGGYIQVNDNNLAVPYQLNLQPNGGSVGIGTGTVDLSSGAVLDVRQSNTGNMSISFMNTYGATSSTAQTVDMSFKLVGSGLTGQVGSMIRTGKEGDYSSGGARDAYMSFSTALDDNLYERMRITAAGSVGIGTTSPNYAGLVSGITVATIAPASGTTERWGALELAGNRTAGENQVGSLYFTNINTTNSAVALIQAINGTSSVTQGSLLFYTNGGTLTERMRITNEGYLGTTVTGTTVSNGDLLGCLSFMSKDTSTYSSGGISNIRSYATATYNTGSVSGDLRFYVSNGLQNTTGSLLFGTEAMRITSGGYLKASNWGSYAYSGAGYHEFDQSSSDWTTTFVNYQNSGGAYGLLINYPRQSPNNGANEFFYCSDSITYRLIIKSNGGISNYQANDTNLSDIRTKKDIIPLESYWDKFKAIEIVKFKYKDQTHDDFNIGVIAQQIEKVAPEFVDTDGFGRDDQKTEEPLKSVYTADLHHATIKVLQEAMAKIEELETKLQDQQQTINSLINR